MLGTGALVPRVVLLLLAAAFARHSYHMLYVQFDYGLHMALCVGLGVTHSLLWVGWSQATCHPRRRLVLAVVCCVHLMSLLELLDFSPFGAMLDAHSLWHAVTPAATAMWYGFVEDDLVYLMGRHQTSVKKS